MATVQVNFNFDDEQISALNAFKIYQRHITKGGNENLFSVVTGIYKATTYEGDGSMGDSDYVDITLYNAPEIEEVK